jgi:hypothetical protein
MRPHTVALDIFFVIVKMLDDVMNKYGASSVQEESALIGDEFINITPTYDKKETDAVLRRILVADREFTRILVPSHKIQAQYDASEPFSPAFLDLRVIHAEVHKLKTNEKDFFKILFYFALDECDSGSRAMDFILSNFTRTHAELEIDALEAAVRRDRTDVLSILCAAYGNELIRTHATNLSLVAVYSSASNAYIYINIVAEDKIDYKFLLHALLEFDANSYAYEIDISGVVLYRRTRLLARDNTTSED